MCGCFITSGQFRERAEVSTHVPKNHTEQRRKSCNWYFPQDCSVFLFTLSLTPTDTVTAPSSSYQPHSSSDYNNVLS